MSIHPLSSGTIADVPVPEFEITGPHGHVAHVSAYGARLMALRFPDGFDAVAAPRPQDFYAGKEHSNGATCGRVAGRIAKGHFVIDGQEWNLPPNNGENVLHGGAVGFSKRIWQANTEQDKAVFELVSEDGDQGFPGTVHARVTYGFEGADLVCDMQASTDAPTLVSITNHVYWNLSGADTILADRLAIFADYYLPDDGKGLATGEIVPVAGTPFDFRTLRPLSDGLVARTNGLDTCFCLSETMRPLTLAAHLEGADGKRSLELYTTERGLVAYMASHFDGSLKGARGQALVRHAGVALEPSGWPAAPAFPAFPSLIVRPGAPYHHRLVWRFAQKA